MVRKLKGVKKRAKVKALRKNVAANKKTVAKKVNKSFFAHEKTQKEQEEKRVRVQTGIPHFDSLIGGGFEQYSTNLLVGNSGSGKSIFAVQFLVEGMKLGEKCLFITFEEKKKQFYDNMKIVGFDLAAFEKKGQFTFLEYNPIKVKAMLEEGGGSIESIILGEKISRIVIDSITSFALLFKDEFSKREAALSLFGMIRNWNCTALLTIEDGPFSGGDFTARTLEFEADSIIILHFIRIKSERERYIEIVKMRGTKHSSKLYRFSIGARGIVVDERPLSDAGKVLTRA